MTATKGDYTFQVHIPTALWQALLAESKRALPNLDLDRERRLAKGHYKTGYLNDDGFRVRAFANQKATTESLVKHFSQVRYPQPVGRIPKKPKWVLAPVPAEVMDASAAACRRLRKLCDSDIHLNMFRHAALREYLHDLVHGQPRREPANLSAKVEQVMAALAEKPLLLDGVRRHLAGAWAKKIAAFVITQAGDVGVRFANGDLVVLPDHRVGTLVREMLGGAVPFIKLPPDEHRLGGGR